MAERIGLEAVLDVSNFNKGLGVYTSGIAQMNKATGNFASTAGKEFVGLGQGILKFGAIAGGVAIGGAAALAAGFVAMGVAALDDVAKFERMTLSITNLVAREISGGQLVEQSRQTITQLTAKETAEIETLTQKIQEESLERQTMVARIQEQRQRVIDLSAAYGDNGLNVQTAKARLAEMEFELTKSDAATAKMTGRINELNAKNGQLVTTLEKVRVGQMSMADAMKEASPRAQELIKWIQVLAIQSPFTSEGIQMAFQTALAYGFTTEQAQRMTEAEVDFVAATGKSAQAADLIALALGQVQARGKLSAQELRQLSEQGIGTNRILEKMGFSLDDVTKGLVDTDKFIEAVLEDMEIFKGAAKAQATTFSGLVSSLSEIKSVGLREFFTGTFEAIRPYLANFVDLLTKAALQTGSIRALGDVLGQQVGGALATINRWATLISQLGGGAGLPIFADLFGPQGITLWGQVSTLIGNVSATFAEWSGVLGGMLPSFSELSTGIIPALISGLAFLNEHFEEFKGALLGIGAVMGAAVFAALAAGLLSLLTPINLILAAAALLGAAWAGNWGGIREITAAVVGFLMGLFDQLVAATTPAFARLMEAFTQVGVIFQGTGLTWQQVGEALLQSTIFVITSIVATIAGLVTAVADTVTAVIGWWATLQQTSNQFVTGIVQLFQGDFANGLTNIFTGLINTIITVFGGGLVVLLTPIQSFITTVIGFWQGMSDTLVGNSIIPDMIASIIAWFNSLAEPVLTVFETLSGGITGILGAVFGALSGGGEAGGGIDFGALISTLTQVIPEAVSTLTGAFEVLWTTLTTGLTGVTTGPLTSLINTLSSIYLLHIPTLSAQFLLWYTTLTTQLITLTAGPLTLFIDTFATIYLVHVPTLTAAWVSMTAIVVSQISAVIASLTSLIGTINQVMAAVNALTSALSAMGTAGKQAGSDIEDGIDDANDTIGDLIELIQKATEEFDKMAEAAQNAADNANQAGSASEQAGGLGFKQGLGFQAGTPANTGGLLGLGFQIPQGYPGDSFGPLFAQSGEQMLITPRGTSIENLVFSRLANLLQGSLVQGGSATNINYNFEMTVNTGASPQAVISQFGVARGLLGA